VREHPFQLSTVCSKLLQEGIEVTKKTLKRFLKTLGYSHKRARAKITKQDAPTHTSKLFQAKIKEREKRGLVLYFLPTYSPELNRIEILWRFMKYHWIEIKDYASTQTLEDYVHRILVSYGKTDGVEINFG
jgi:transposase